MAENGRKMPAAGSAAPPASTHRRLGAHPSGELAQLTAPRGSEASESAANIPNSGSGYKLRSRTGDLKSLMRLRITMNKRPMLRTVGVASSKSKPNIYTNR